MRILLINQFVPPDSPPTARLLGDLAAALLAQGHEVAFVGATSGYRGSKRLLGSRALREAWSLVQLLVHALTLPTRCEVIVALSSPPLLLVVARLARLRHRDSRLIHWAMDLYPEVAVALGELSPGSWLHRLTRSLMTGAYRSCDRVIALDSDMAAALSQHGLDAAIQPPWPGKISGPPDATTKTSGFEWLYSGNLGRAHEWQTLLDAQRRLEDQDLAVTLVFQGGGAERSAAQAYATRIGLERCEWRPYVDDEDLVGTLLQADCLIATQRPETLGCLWPSKLALAVHLDRPILWVGPAEGAVTQWLADQGHLCFEPGDAEAVARAIRDLLQSPAASPSVFDFESAASAIDQTRDEGIATLVKLVEG